MNFEQKNGGEHCTADNSPQDVFHCDADENEFAGFILKNLPLVRAAQSKGCILTAAIEFQMRITQVRVRTASSYLPYAFRLMKKKQNFMSLIIPCKRKTLRSGQMQICLP